jgi:hypothetical protein
VVASLLTKTSHRVRFRQAADGLDQGYGKRYCQLLAQAISFAPHAFGIEHFETARSFRRAASHVHTGGKAKRKSRLNLEWA